MITGYHRFRLGEFECIAVSDGSFNYPLESFFANAPRSQLEEVLRRKGLPTDYVSTPYTCLFVDTGAHRVMIDTGAGALGANASKFFPSVDHSTTITGNLLQNMQAAGVDAADVDTVVITHAHPDHIGGTLNEDGTLAFSTARYFIAREEWGFWMSEVAEQAAPAPMVAIARQALEPLRDRVSLIKDGAEIVPGIRAVATPGHTPGHLALSVRSADEQLLHISDTVLHPLHLEHPDWVPVFDAVPEQAAASKQRIFDRAVREKALIFAHHFPPFPNIGSVTGAEVGWNWHPRTEESRAPLAGSGGDLRAKEDEPVEIVNQTP